MKNWNELESPMLKIEELLIPIQAEPAFQPPSQTECLQLAGLTCVLLVFLTAFVQLT